MKIGLSEQFNGGNRGVDFAIGAAQLAEGLGFEEIWFPEHVVYFPDYESDYPYGSQGQAEVHSLRGKMEPFVAIAAMASATTTIRFGTYVCVVAERHPIHLAREVATVDEVSRGRFDFGVGVGWLQGEYEAVGVPFAARGRRTDECLAAMKELWIAEESSFHGEFYNFGPLYANPKPRQSPHPPILVGGNSPATIKRIVEYGDGWLGYTLEPDEVARFIEDLDGALSKAGRSLDDVQLMVGRRAKEVSDEAWEADARYIEQVEKLGIEQVVLSPRIPLEGYEEKTRALARIVGLG
ncbi:LLM class F420-dependent oxidoreductase [Nocardioides sp. zg-ZUI104]|uniref:LLM class F420-dependent oxidoreductase n=1 Tax=Nocardioides faecalis TaxID=2803858 RepID=UPI001BD036D7|nr:LLM class F420-dependent oxidoreductase [Nocardioides faecalis]MBS4754538.1 LLM class F420-dependent oxidoreductase [Nocardioides faecalis]